MEAKKDVKWVLTVSLIMFFYSAYTTPPTYWASSPSGVLTSRPDSWYYAGIAAVFFFLITILLATLHTADFGKGKPLYQTTIARAKKRKKGLVVCSLNGANCIFDMGRLDVRISWILKILFSLFLRP